MPEPAPWTKGVHPGYSAFVVEVHVRKDESGDLRSFRRLQDERDEHTLEKMSPTGGLMEGSWALLTEALRAEAMLQLLVKISNDAEFKAKMEAGDADVDDLIENLSNDTLEQVKRGLDELVPRVAREAIHRVRDGLRNEDG